jgi:type IV secretory pathway VirJ component
MMIREIRRRALAALTVAAMSGAAAWASQGPIEMTVARFGKVTVYMPAREPKDVALFLSGDGGWNLGVVDMARALAESGSIVVGIDIRHYLATLANAGPACQSLAVDFENLSHHVQKQLGLAEYHVPVLVGYSSGATVVYATLAQSPSGTFAGALSLGFCPDQEFGGAKLCTGAGLHYTAGKKSTLIFEPAGHLEQSWVALQGQKDMVCDAKTVDDFAARTKNAEVVKLPLVGHGFSVERNWLPQFKQSYARLAAASAPPPSPAPEIDDIPVTEVRAAAPGNRFALLLTGDGGWAGLDREVAARLAAQGVSTVGLNSLRYFWHARTPEDAASDVARVLRHYLAAWTAKDFLLVGYSFGADVLPFIVNRLPDDLHARVASVNLLGLSTSATFEIHVSDWLPGTESGGMPVLPEVSAIQNSAVLCLYAENEHDSLCPQLPANRVTSVQLAGGHHFGGDYTALGDRILQFAQGSH